MDPHLLALASSGSFEKLESLLIRSQDDEASAGTTRRAGPCEKLLQTALDIMEEGEASSDSKNGPSSILEGVTAEGDTALHVVAAACGFDSDNFLESARIIYGKARHLLFAQNKNGDTPLHCAARSGKSNMVNCLIDLAFAEGGEDRMKELLRRENKHKETALHEAVRVGDNHMVDLFMGMDSELASFPDEDGGGGSPMYLALVLKQGSIANTLLKKSNGNISFAGQNGQNVLHAAVLVSQDLTKLLEWDETCLGQLNKDHITKQGDKNGSTPLHFAAAIEKPSRICRQVLKANPDALYQADHAGCFPIHVAASVGASGNVAMFVTECPGSAGLRDAKGRTFLHVAVEKKEVNVTRIACRNQSLSWIMNMVDNDGNTALHLAVQKGGLRMFCHLLANPQVILNLPNNKGETPFDIAEYKLPKDGLYYNQNSEVQIRNTLQTAGAVKGGVRRQDYLLEDSNTSVRVKSHDDNESKRTKVLKDSTQTLSIGSVLITTMTFGATFAVPGGYTSDDHNSHGGTPIHAGRYAFGAFTVANTLAFLFSAMATIAVMYSGSPFLNPRSREMHLLAAFYLLSISIASLAAAFALGAYLVLAPVAHKTAVGTCVLTSLAMLYRDVEFVWIRLLLLPPLHTRKGLIWTCRRTAIAIMSNTLLNHWPLLVIFGWAAYANPN